MSSGFLFVILSFLALFVGALVLSRYSGHHALVTWLRLGLLLVLLLFSAFGFLAAGELNPGTGKTVFHLVYGSLIVSSITSIGFGIRSICRGR
ncbi:hypothetical protein N8766_03700 [bacterium]|jgi:hypothetical protein|nr:hypothetical protein [Verrucomicrobiota bacterium]MDA7633190.1 hypothetical protein [bacterium]MDA7667695.1 hypothetical protein [bacterium]